MANATNFLEQSFSPFIDRVHEAAEHGNLNATPLLGALNRAQAIARGVAQIAKMQITNEVQADAFSDREVGEVIEPPMSPYAVSVLMALAAAACDLLVDDIDRAARQANQYGILESSNGK
ncbi:hypothetical protein [Paraburkholderia bryophila]|uniref:Uncharacterized protein n=1 Tax=Paraburkholderia bryophila TaxID=420952 RepID=A0A329CNP2_9BURK|nr:hypothetical protein [Paraburkholderia bryophila]RAS35858.1 hypothetical protein BX591_104188 [Paraburkholderia bryophila]